MVFVNTVTSNISRWTVEIIIKSNGFKRTITSLSLLVYLILALYVGVPFIIPNTLIIQIKSFEEVMNVAYRIKKFPHIPLFKGLIWYLIIISNYYCFGETFAQYSEPIINKYYLLHILTFNHRFISFSFYLVGLVFFVILLDEEILLQQFNLLFWTHFLIIILTVQSFFFIQNLYNGLIWLIVPLILIILNDTFAYLIGKNFGKTPLITLSPKKTVEGFVGGGLASIFIGAVLSNFFCHFNYLVCPIKYAVVDNEIYTLTNCTRSSLFQPIPYYIGNEFYINLYPFLRHALYMAVFISLVAPFGGFFASGFKRAANIKDFGYIFPGHGGFMDRFDCCFLMGTFINVYIGTFAKNQNAEDIFQKVMTLAEEKQLQFYLLLKNSLSDNFIKS